MSKLKKLYDTHKQRNDTRREKTLKRLDSIVEWHYLDKGDKFDSNAINNFILDLQNVYKELLVLEETEVLLSGMEMILDYEEE